MNSIIRKVMLRITEAQPTIEAVSLSRLTVVTVPDRNGTNEQPCDRPEKTQYFMDFGLTGHV